MSCHAFFFEPSSNSFFFFALPSAGAAASSATASSRSGIPSDTLGSLPSPFASSSPSKVFACSSPGISAAPPPTPKSPPAASAFIFFAALPNLPFFLPPPSLFRGLGLLRIPGAAAADESSAGTSSLSPFLASMTILTRMGHCDPLPWRISERESASRKDSSALAFPAASSASSAFSFFLFFATSAPIRFAMEAYLRVLRVSGYESSAGDIAASIRILDPPLRASRIMRVSLESRNGIESAFLEPCAIPLMQRLSTVRDLLIATPSARRSSFATSASRALVRSEPARSTSHTLPDFSSDVDLRVCVRVTLTSVCEREEESFITVDAISRDSSPFLMAASMLSKSLTTRASSPST
mmetsp:Transcript_28845/g.92090  ORF Transcript_28845/g.92090 Transcript_28845/m.92090 type:complete len:354 (+) Transcript_28845:454-1515(+)